MYEARPLIEPERATDDEKPVTFGKAVFLVGMGQALESYDFILFGLMSPFLGAQFFAASGRSPIAATLYALAVYGVGFIFRPLGAVLLGILADRIGRRPIMLWSVGLMSASSLMIGALPTTNSIGLAATIIVVFTRVIQGIAFGVEVPLNAAYNVELGKRANQVGRVAGIIQAYAQIGLILGSLVSFLVSLALGPTAMADWGWRVPFLLGAGLGLLLVILRRGLPETLHEHAAPPTDRPTQSIWTAVWHHRIAALATIFVVGGVQILNYALNVALPSIAQSRYGVSSTLAFGTTIVFGSIILILSPLFGRLADRIKVSRAFVIARLLLIPASFLLLLYRGGGTLGFILTMLLGALFLAPNLALFNVIGATLVPTEIRATGGGLAYSLGVTIFGGTAAFILVWAQMNGWVWLFCAYGSAVCLLSVVFYRWAVRATGIHGGA